MNNNLPPLEEQAMEYALGTLPTERRKEFEQQLRHDLKLQQIVSQWRDSLHNFAEELPSKAAPTKVWEKIEAQIGQNRPTLWNNLNLWRNSSIAAMLLLASFVTIILPALQENSAEAYMMVVTNPKQQPLWLLSNHPQQQGIQVKNLNPTNIAKGERCILWMVAEDGSMQAIGVLPETQDQQVTFSWPSHNSNPIQAALAVSVEPIQQTLGQRPTTATIYQGNWLRM